LAKVTAHQIQKSVTYALFSTLDSSKISDNIYVKSAFFMTTYKPRPLSDVSLPLFSLFTLHFIHFVCLSHRIKGVELSFGLL
jgi:hypothetical protein